MTFWSQVWHSTTGLSPLPNKISKSTIYKLYHLHALEDVIPVTTFYWTLLASLISVQDCSGKKIETQVTNEYFRLSSLKDCLKITCGTWRNLSQQYTVKFFGMERNNATLHKCTSFSKVPVSLTLNLKSMIRIWHAVIPCVNTKTFGERSFSYVGASVSNSLPPQTLQFFFLFQICPQNYLFNSYF